MVKLRWLQVNKFRAVKPGTRLTFNTDYNVLLGQNGTGKTTLLNLIAAVIKSDFNDFKDEEFDLAYELTLDKAIVSVTVCNDNQFADVPLGLSAEDLSVFQSEDMATADKMRSALLSFSAKMSSIQSGVQVYMEGSDRTAIAQRVGKSRNSKVAFDSPFVPGLAVVAVMMATGLAALLDNSFLSQMEYSELIGLTRRNRARRFDESLQYFNSLSEIKTTLFRSLKGPEPIFTLSRGIMDEQLAAKAKQKWGESQYIFNDAEFQFLSHTVRFLDLESAEAVLELQRSDRQNGLDIMVLGHLRFYFSGSNGSKISEGMLSYGQKRMLAFMHYLDAAQSTIIADELVNGLHHRWIRACFELMGERQKFLTSQNPLLLDYLSFKSPADVRSTFVLCSWDKPSGQMLWENMTEEAAEDFFASYKVGFQQVGELLQAKGLW